MNVTLENRQFVSLSELRRMKLSAKEIRALGKPDTYIANPHGYSQPMHLYAVERVTKNGSNN
jgi:hypothetical protein